MISDFCKTFPKLELHAHLNGSLSKSTLQRLLKDKDKYNSYKSWLLNSQPENTLSECFNVFKIAHEATSDINSVYEATFDVIGDFANDHVCYLELRTTPRSEANMTERQYIDAVIEAIKARNEVFITKPKLLLSLDRRKPLAWAQETASLITQYHTQHPDIVVGLDVSGDPSTGDWFETVLSQVRNSGLKISLHCAEVPNAEETAKMLAFKPDRVGHGTCIHPKNSGTSELWDLLLASKIPVECCLTSNVKTKTIKRYDEHHIKDLLSANHPFSLCTDDKGVFSTELSEEYEHAIYKCGLNVSDVWYINYRAVEYAFCSDREKVELRNALNSWAALNVEYFGTSD